MPEAARLGAIEALEIAPEEALRSQFYSLLARFLSSPPTDAELKGAAGLEGNGTSLGQAISSFSRASRGVTVAEAEREYHELFIGLGRGEIIPYGSYYLTGFLHEKPLAKLRQDMARLGVTRDPAVSEPEDHIASLLEMMAGFIDGRFGAPLDLAQQKAFFDVHIASWASHFFKDLEGAKAFSLYAAVGAVGAAFLDLEARALAVI